MNEGKKELLGGLLRLSLGTIGVTIGEAELEKMAEKGNKSDRVQASDAFWPSTCVLVTESSY